MKHALPYPPPWQDAPTLCAHLCISGTTLDNWVREGRLPPPKLVGSYRVWKWADVEKCRKGRVYFIESGGLIKIGFTEYLKSRLSTLAGSSAHPIETLLVIWGPRSLEAKLHERFSADRDHGEWFRKTTELVEYIDKIKPWGVS